MGLFVALLFVGGFFAALAYAVKFTQQQEKKRTAAFSALAAEHDYQFTAGNDPNILSKYEQYRLFRGGRSKRGQNSLMRTQEDLCIHIFEYSFTTGHGKNTSKNHRTCIHISGNAAKFPHFFLRQESAVLDFLGKLFGGEDINFASDPEFSEHFVLQGDDTEQTRHFFSAQQTRNAFMNYKGIDATIEGRDNALLIALSQNSPENLALDIDHAIVLYNSIVPST